MEDQTDEQIAAAAERAQRSIAAAQTLCEQTDETARAARAAFEAEPNAKTLATQGIEAQRATNALRALEQLQTTHEALFTESTRRAQLRRIAELKELVYDAWDARTRDAANLIAESVVSLRERLQTEIETLDVELAARNRLAAELDMLERKFGSGNRVQAITLDYVVGSLRAAVVAGVGADDLRGSVYPHPTRPAVDLRVWATSGLRLCQVDLRVSLPPESVR